MDVRPALVAVARALRERKLEAILIGNAAAALQGAPVSTVDLDFLIRDNAANSRKLKLLAESPGAALFRPEYPASNLIRLMRDEDSLQIDFMMGIHGVRSFHSVQRRAVEVEIEGERVQVAALADIIASKRAAGRPRDRAVFDVLEKRCPRKNLPPERNQLAPKCSKP